MKRVFARFDASMSRASALLLCAAIGLTACGDGTSKTEEDASAAAVVASPTSSHEDGGDWDLGVRLDADARRAIGGSVVIHTGEPIRSLNPLRMSAIETRVLKYHLVSYLITENPELIQAQAWLARSLPSVTGDGAVHEWALREGARWNDGAPLTTADVAFTFDVLRDERLQQSTARALAERIESIEIIDELRFRVRQRAPGFRSWLDFGLGFAILPKHALPADAVAIERLSSLPVGSGPYQVQSIDGASARLKRISPWWADEVEPFARRHLIAEVTYKHVPVESQVVAQLESGDLDFAALQTASAFRKIRDSGKEHDLRTACYHLPLWSSISWNVRHPLLGDARVRRALDLLVPRNAINEAYYEGLALPATGPFAGCDPALESPKVGAPESSVTEAKKLLADAGFSDSDDDGVLDRDGRAFAITILHQPESIGWAEGLLEQTRAAWAQVGIKAQRDAQSNLFQPNGVLRRGDFDGFLAVWPMDAILPDPREYFAADGAWNLMRYESEDFEAAYADYVGAKDDAQRVLAARRMHEVLHADQPMCWLFRNPIWIAWNKRIKGVEAHHLGVRQWDFWIEPRH